MRRFPSRGITYGGRFRVAPPNFTVWLLHNNSVDARNRIQSEQEKMLVGDIEFVKGIDDTIMPAFVRLYIGNDQFKKRGITSGVYRNAVQGTFKFLPTGI